ncbi:MAG: YwmB family TATA-box binding protein [Syntrophomonadaceae bacterium]|jgi:hypothetical protein
MRRAVMYLIVFSILCLLMQQGINHTLGNQIKNQSPFCLSFTSIGANLLESRLDCWAKIRLTSTSKDLEQNLIQILQHLRLPVERKGFIYNTSPGIIELSYSCDQESLNYNFCLTSSQPNKETYYIITVISSKDSPKLREIAQKLQSIANYSTYYSYTGTIPNLYDSNSHKRMLQNILKQLNAQTVEFYSDTNCASVTGYSKTLKEWVEPIHGGRNKYNVQAAIKSNKQKHTTEIYIGSPLLLGDY